MSTNYTSEELAKIAGAVTISGMAVAIVEAGIISTAIEATAMGKEVAGGNSIPIFRRSSQTGKKRS
jgi:hypothetical protein